MAPYGVNERLFRRRVGEGATRYQRSGPRLGPEHDNPVMNRYALEGSPAIDVINQTAGRSQPIVGDNDVASASSGPSALTTLPVSRR